MKLSTRLLLSFSVILFLSVIDSAFNYVLSLKVEKNIEFLSKSQDIMRNSTGLHKSIIEMQSSFRGYLLTADTQFLDGYKEGIIKIPILLAEQKKLIKENEAQLVMIDSIEQWHRQWNAYATLLIDAKNKETASEPDRKNYHLLFENQLKRKIGKKINDKISQQFLEFDRSEYKLRTFHRNNLISSIERTHTISSAFFLLTIISGIFSAVYIMRLISKRIKTMVELAENISKGKFITIKDNRHDELTSLSSSLNIMSDNLSRTIRELEKRNVELDKFAYVVSHDLKAPVRGIHNVIKWIEEDLGNELSPQMKKYLSIIPQRTQRMEDLINGLLTYARLREKSALEKTDVRELVEEIVALIVPRSFKVEMNDLPVFATQRFKLEQVFTNLISNAVKYIHHEKGHIIISCQKFPDYYGFSIKDNGIGIEPEYHEKIFELFQTLREKDEKESTGIGLAIVKKIIDEQQGTIKVKSALNEGAEFIFTWPLT
jgi:signal transduction histidine kinase